MTVTTELNRNDYVASASQTVFPYTFKIFAATDLEVYVNDVLQVGGYSVSGVGVDAGGDVTFAVGLDAADAVAIVRDTPYTQEIDYTSYTKFPAETQELGLDKNTILAIQAREVSNRSFRYAASYGGTAGRELTAPVPNQILGYDAGGELTTYTFSGGDVSDDFIADLASTDSGKGSSLVGWAGNSLKTVTTGLDDHETRIGVNEADIVIAGQTGLSSVQVFTADGTWTKPTGVTSVVVEVIGGGGAGADGFAGGGAYSGGGGGGGGAAVELLDVTGDATAAVTVGAATQTSSFILTTTSGGCSATGGATGVTVVGGAGGSGADGDVNIGGSDGLSSIVGAGIGGGGGSAAGWSGGGGGKSIDGGIGQPGGNYGGGGGGGDIAGPTAGGAGAGGIVVVWEYK